MKNAKRGIAMLLTVLMLLGALSGIGAATTETTDNVEQKEDVAQADDVIIDESDDDAESLTEDFGSMREALLFP